MVLRTRLVALALAGLSIAACATVEGEETDPDADYSALSAAPRELAIDEDPSVLVEHPETLRLLES